MRQRVLITGGSGLLALNWAQAMRDRCVITLGLHNRHISLAGTISKMVNLESVSQLVRVFDELECKVVINAAGLTSIERCESDPALAQHANVTLASNIAKTEDCEIAKLTDNRCLTCVSSGKVITSLLSFEDSMGIFFFMRPIRE